MSEYIGGYRLVEYIGGGGLADVYRAEAVFDGATVAVKVLRDPDRSEGNSRRFLREGQLLQRLTMDGLPRCLEVISEPRPALVLEFLDGETLLQAIARREALPPEEVLTLAGHILRALSALHQRGVVHRDVKSSNIFLARSGRVLLLDLGLAVDPDDPFTTTMGDVLGTYAYMAPEQLAGITVDARSDLYSLGITLYEALAGRRPYSARGAGGYLRAHRSGGALLLSEQVQGLTPRLDRLVSDLMERDPSARPPSAAIALAMLSGHSSLQGELASPRVVGRWATEGAVQGILDGGGALSLVGELGSGVGLAARMVLTQAHESGVEVVALRCAPEGRCALATSLAVALSRLLSQELPPAGEELARAVSHLCHEGPFLIMVEDLQHATPEDAALLRALVEGDERLRLVTISSQISHDIGGRVQRLRHLTREEVKSLVAGMLSTIAPPADLVGLLARETGGMPGLVVSAVRDLYHRGLLVRHGTAAGGEPDWKLDTVATRGFSFSFEAQFGRLLKRLDEEHLQALKVLAVAGGSLPLHVCLRAAGLGPSGLELHALESLGVLAIGQGEEGVEHVRLRRPAVSSWLLRQVAGESRQAIHRSLAEVLRAMPPSPWRNRQLQLHAALAAPPEQAASGLLLLLGEALEAWNRSLAMEITAHLDSLSIEDPALFARRALARAELLLADGFWKEAGASASACARLARDVDPVLAARAMVLLTRVDMELGHLHRAEARLDEVSVLLGRRPGSASVLVEITLLRARRALQRGADLEARHLFQEAARRARRRGLPRLEAEALMGPAVLLSVGGGAGAALGVLDRAEARLGGLPPDPIKVRSLLIRGECLLLQGTMDSAMEAVTGAARLAAAMEMPHLEAAAGVAEARVAISSGAPARASELLKRNQVARDARSQAEDRVAYHEVAGLTRLAMSDVQSALAAFNDMAEAARAAGIAALAAFGEGMTGVMTGDAGLLSDSLGTLDAVGDTRRLAMLLYQGALFISDHAALESALDEIRRSHDVPLLVRALHAVGGEAARLESAPLAERLVARAGPYQRVVAASPAVRWALAGPSGEPLER